MSGTNRRTVYVGLFVFIAVVIFAGAILAVGSLQNAFTPKITVHAVFTDVGGLQTGDSVWSSGLRVGVVKKLDFIEAAKVDVTLDLNTSMVPFIPSDSVATIGADGLIGNPIVVLAEGTPEADAIKAGARLEIGTAVSTTQIMETLQVNNQNLVAITGDIKVLTAGLRAGEGTLGRVLKEDDLYTEVQTALADVKEASAYAKQLTARLASFSAQLDKPGQLPHDLMHDEEIMPSIRAAVAGLEATAAQATELVAGLSADLGDPNTPLGVLMSDEESGGDLKETLSNIEQATVLLNEDLLAIQSNFLFRGYFKKQERLERKEARDKAREEKKSK